MPSMSYCVFENTDSDMSQCVERLSEAVDDGISLVQFLEECSSDYERRAVRSLVEQSRSLIELYEQLESCEEEELVYDEA